MAAKTEAAAGNFFTRMGIFFGQVRTEMEKVTWPSKEDLKVYTMVVLISAFVVCVLIGLWDVALTRVLSQVLLIGA